MSEALFPFFLAAAVPDLEDVTRPYLLKATRERVALGRAVSVAADGQRVSMAGAVASPPDGDPAQRLATLCACAMRGLLNDAMPVSVLLLRWFADQEARLRVERDQERERGAERAAKVEPPVISDVGEPKGRKR